MPVQARGVQPLCGVKTALDGIKRRLDLRRWLLPLARHTHGQDLIEYALLAGFISLVAVVSITNVGASVNTVYGNVSGQVQAIPGGGGGVPEDANLP